MARHGSLTGGLLTGVLIFSTVGSSFAQRPRAVVRDQKEPPPVGPIRPGAPLPAAGPICPGEPEAEGPGAECKTNKAKEAHEDAESNQDGDGNAEAQADNQGDRENQGGDTKGEEDLSGARAPLLEQKRPKPDYDGLRRNERPGRPWLWAPRILLSPLYLVSEYAVRRPVGALVKTSLRNGWVQEIRDFFTFGKRDQVRILPTALFDFRFRPSFGAFAFWNDALTEGHDLRARAATGGIDWWQFDLQSRHQLPARSGEHTMVFDGSVTTRPDYLFFGIGPRVGEQEFRYGNFSTRAGVRSEFELWRLSEVEVESRLRTAEFFPGERCCRDASIAEGVETGQLDVPPGLNEGFEVLDSGIRARFDTRHPRFPENIDASEDRLAPPGSGIQLEVQGNVAQSFRWSRLGEGETASTWARYGAKAGGYVALPGWQRTVGLEVRTEFADPITDGQVPFTELASLGGSQPLRGFRQGRLLGQSAASATLSYTWPVWVLLEGVIEYGVGNVFGRHLEDFEPELLRQSFGVGLQSNVDRAHSFQFLVAAGTEPFIDGSQLESFRFVIGGTSGL